jgi:hypothetical protein
MEELWAFRSIANLEHPAFVRLVDAYIELVKRSEIPQGIYTPPERKAPRRKVQMHLFDLLREKTFFPQNLDLAQFASRIMPNMRAYRFDKMSRGDIAARIIEYLEDQTEKSSRDRLEDSMRTAMMELQRKPSKEADRKSFLSEWEKIIKGVEL